MRKHSLAHRKIRDESMSDQLLSIFLWIWELVYCILALPLFLGLAWLVVGAVSEVLDILYLRAMDNKPFFYLISVIVGIALKLWAENKRSHFL